MSAVGMAILCSHVAAAPVDQRGETVTTISDQKEVAVTIYNDDLALVKDARRVNLEREFNKLAWRGVSAQMRPETALLRNLSHPAGFRLQEQNFDFDLLTPEKLLEKNLNKPVTVITADDPHRRDGHDRRGAGPVAVKTVHESARIFTNHFM